MKSYDLVQKLDRARFEQLVRVYDAALPWSAKESLAAHIDEIDADVCGSLHRLRKWLP